MSDSPHLAFGNYLRRLRHRRELSLETVATFSRRLPEPLSPSYLSRCEHGLRLPGISKVITISQILDVPTQVLLDKLSIENELRRIELPHAPKLPPEQLLRQAREAIRRSKFWESYQLSRTIEERLTASDDSLDAPTQDVLAEAMIRSAWSAARLGCIDLCVHELRHVHRIGAGTWHRRASVLEALSAVLVHQGKHIAARDFADDLHAQAVEREDPSRLAAALMRRAKIAEAVDARSGLARYLEVDQALRAPAMPAAQATRISAYVLAGMSECYRKSRRPQAARRATLAFLERARATNETHAVDLARIYLGNLELERGAERAAHRLWSRTAESTAACKNRPLEFRVRYRLLELAERRSEATRVERILARLAELYPWAVEGEPEYEAFRRRQSASPRALADRPSDRTRSIRN